MRYASLRSRVSATSRERQPVCRPQARTVRGSGKKKPSTREGSALLAERVSFASLVLVRLFGVITHTTPHPTSQPAIDCTQSLEQNAGLAGAKAAEHSADCLSSQCAAAMTVADGVDTRMPSTGCR